MNLFTLPHFPIKNKTIFLRVDFNVPLQERKITDTTKIKATLPTIKCLLQQKCKIVLATHLGQPRGKVVPELQVEPLVQELKRLLPKQKIIPLEDCIGSEIRNQIVNGKPQQIFFLENLRFYPQEENNNPIFAHALASLADIYINDAFGVAHRKHASIDAITHFLPSGAGFLLEKEIKYLSQALHPKRPAIWIMGGAKLHKIGLIKQALKKADYILIGGALAFAFLKAQNIPVGLSKIDADSIHQARTILHTSASKKIILPLDFVVAEKFSSTAKTAIVPYDTIQPNQLALDLGPQTIKLYQHYLRKAHTIVWNGPLGYFEWAKFATATKEIGRFIGKLTATTIVGGGETADAIIKFHLQHELTHLSTGGGAAMEFLSGQELPGIIALEKNYTKFKKKMQILN